jgi:hypothetical protein
MVLAKRFRKPLYFICELVSGGAGLKQTDFRFQNVADS